MADKLVFLVCGECPASSVFSEEGVGRLTKEWLEIIERDYNYRSIVTWVLMNDSWGVPDVAHDKQQQSHMLGMYYLIHSLDKT